MDLLQTEVKLKLHNNDFELIITELYYMAMSKSLFSILVIVGVVILCLLEQFWILRISFGEK